MAPSPRTLGERVGGNIIALAGSATLGRALGIAWLPYLTRRLAPPEFGLYVLVAALGMVATTLFQWGSGAATVRAMARSPEPRARAELAGALLLFRLLGTLLLLALLLAAAATPFAPQPLTHLLLLAAPGFAGEMLRTVYDATLLAHDRPRSAALLGAAQQIVAIGAGVAVLESGLGLPHLIAARAAVALLGGAVALLLLFRHRLVRLPGAAARLPRLARAALPFGALALLLTLDTRVDLLMLAAIPGRSAARLIPTTLATGIYGVPLRIIQVLLVPLAPIRAALVPSIAPLVDHDPARAGEIYRAATRILAALLLVPALLLLIPAAAPLVRLAAPAAYRDGATALRILLVAAALMAAQAPAAALASVSHRTSHLLAPVALALLLNCVANALLIPLWSYNGAALATLFSALVGLLYRLSAAEATIGSTLRRAHRHLYTPGLLLWPPVAAALLIALQFVVPLLAAAVAALTLYLTALWRGRVLAPTDRRRVARLARGLLRR